MKTYNLYREQIIDAPLSNVWDFFSSPENLNALTPDDMSFEITSPQPIPRMFKGQVIEYKVAPILNIPLRWKTLITEVEDGRFFVDEQTKGPYKYWRHEHRFEATPDNKVKMTDNLDYALPFGLLGQIAHALFVKNRLAEIFDYRYRKVEEFFNNVKERSERIDNSGKSISIEGSTTY